MIFGDSTFVLLIPAIIFAFWAQSKVGSAFRELSRVPSSSRLTGAQVARQILDRAGLGDVTIERVSGRLADHYDPRSRVLRLSPEVHDHFSLAALGVAAHEAGHALQDREGYLWLGLRSSLYPIASFGSNLAWPLFLIGLVFASGIGSFLMDLGIYLFAAAVLFTVVTLPVEYNASARAIALLESGGFITRAEVAPTRRVLDAAALTYVAATLMAVLQLVRLLVLRGASRND